MPLIGPIRHKLSVPNADQSQVASLLSDLVSRAVDTACFVLDLSDFSFPSLEDKEMESEEVNIHPLHSHLLLYTSCRVDTRTAVWALQCLQVTLDSYWSILFSLI